MYTGVFREFHAWVFFIWFIVKLYPDSNVHGANMGPTWVLLAPCWPHEPCFLGYHISVTKPAVSIMQNFIKCHRQMMAIVCRPPWFVDIVLRLKYVRKIGSNWPYLLMPLAMQGGKSLQDIKNIWVMLMGSSKKDATPVLMHWSYVLLALTHWCVPNEIEYIGEHHISWPCFNLKLIFHAVGILIIKIRQSHDCLIFITGIPVVVRCHIYIEIPHILKYVQNDCFHFKTSYGQHFIYNQLLFKC